MAPTAPILHWPVTTTLDSACPPEISNIAALWHKYRKRGTQREKERDSWKMLATITSKDLPHTQTHTLQRFPGILIALGIFLDSFLLEMNFICWKLDSMAPVLDRLLGNSYWICPTRMQRTPGKPYKTAQNGREGVTPLALLFSLSLCLPRNPSNICLWWTESDPDGCSATHSQLTRKSSA